MSGPGLRSLAHWFSETLKQKWNMQSRKLGVHPAQLTYGNFRLRNLGLGVRGQMHASEGEVDGVTAWWDINGFN